VRKVPNNTRNPLIFPFLFASLVILCPPFFIKYVPLVKPFLLVLFPVLLLVFILTALNIERGTIFFVFIFPLINSLPYFWGLFEHIPSAPVALIVFYFFLMGLAVNMTFSKRGPIYRSDLHIPILAFSCLIFISTRIFIHFCQNRSMSCSPMSTE